MQAGKGLEYSRNLQPGASKAWSSRIEHRRLDFLSRCPGWSSSTSVMFLVSCSRLVVHHGISSAAVPC
eukprot:2167031-Amphidinium_carterae.1